MWCTERRPSRALNSPSSSRVVAKLERGEIPSNTESPHWFDEQLLVPSVPARLSKCKIIEISYSLELESLSAGRDAKVSVPIVIGTIPLLSDLLKAQKKRSEAGTGNGSALASPASNCTDSGEDAVVQVTITDESGRTDEMDLGGEEELLCGSGEADNQAMAKRRVRMPSSILSELYPTLPSPYYRESCFGRVNIADEKELSQFGDTLFAPKYPFYTD